MSSVFVWKRTLFATLIRGYKCHSERAYVIALLYFDSSYCVLCCCSLWNWCLCDSYLSCSIYCFLADFDMRYFWAWTDFMSYVDFMLLFTIVCSTLMYIFIDFMPFVELVGFLAVFTEALLGVPQVLRNYHNKSTEGMRWAKANFVWLSLLFLRACSLNSFYFTNTCTVY